MFLVWYALKFRRIICKYSSILNIVGVLKFFLRYFKMGICTCLVNLQIIFRISIKSTLIIQILLRNIFVHQEVVTGCTF